MYQRKLLVNLLLLCAFLAVAATAYPHSRSGGSKTFTQNVGQVTDQHFNSRNDIDFKLSANNGVGVFIGSGKMHYQWMANKQNGTEDDHPSSPMEMYRMDVTLIGANPNAKVITEGKSTQQERYYTNGLEGAVAHGYNRITYKDIYPHIDQVFYFTQNGLLEYDFVVHPGGKVSDIRLQYSGAKELKLNTDGSLTATTPMGIITENAPITYQQKDKKSVPSAFQLDGDILSFSTAAYNGTLIIDPVLEWATYFGDSEYDAINAIAYGKDGFIYAVGNTNSASNIATTGSHQATFAGGSMSSGADAFLAKFNTDGDLIWATYYGGTNVDQGSGIAVDTSGYIYIAGRTSSITGIATTGTHQDTKAGTFAGFDAFIVKFDSAGIREWGTYFGGTSAEGSQSITLTCDKQNNLYLAGNTASTSGIATTGTHQTIRSGSGDGFIAKFSTVGIRVWGTYFGGASTDFINVITTDIDGDIYITGYTNSNDGIATSGSYQVTNAGGSDAFVSKFDAFGSQIWGSYLGGIGYDESSSITVDEVGNTYISGITASVSGVSSLGTHQTTYGGGDRDFFITRFNSDGTLSWSTYYGGSLNEAGASVYLDIDNLIYLAGRSNSPDGIATFDGIISSYNYNGEGKVVLASFDTTGQRIWGSYLGGNLTELNTSVVTKGDGSLFMAGYTNSTLDLATLGAYQDIFGGNRDGYLLKVNMCFVPEAPDTIFGTLEVCSSTPVVYHANAVNGADSYEWILPNGWAGNSITDTITIIANSSGTLKVVALNDCGHSDTISLDVNVLPAPNPVISRNGNRLSVNQTYPSYQWNKNGQPISGATLPTYAVTENGTYSVTVTAVNGCVGTSDAQEFTGLSIRNLGQQFNLYPNPATETITISISSRATIEVFDITGRSLQKKVLKAGTNSVDISHFNNGLYILRIHILDGSYMGEAKLVKVGE